MDHRAAVVEEILKDAHAGALPAVRWTDIKGDPSPHAEEGDVCSTRAGVWRFAMAAVGANTGKWAMGSIAVEAGRMTANFRRRGVLVLDMSRLCAKRRTAAT